MPECQICKHNFKVLRFSTKHINICRRCVNSLNENPEHAINAQNRFSEMLKRGMERNAMRDLQSSEEWKQIKARRILNNLDASVSEALHDWITSLLRKPENSTRDFKIMRAYRRGLLRMEGFADYPGNWKDVAHSIRVRDAMRCTECGSAGCILDVHHIIHLSKGGTNQQSNLITLCRPCHETEHGRIFDSMERSDPEISQPPQSALPNALPRDQAPTAKAPKPIDEDHPTISNPPVDLTCPKCDAQLTARLSTAILANQKVRCPVCSLVFCAEDGFGFRLRSKPKSSPTAKPPPAPVQKAPAPVATESLAPLEKAPSPHLREPSATQIQPTEHPPKNTESSGTAAAGTNRPKTDKTSGHALWSTALQLIAFLIGWGAAAGSPEPVKTFFVNWALWAGIFWSVSHFISGRGK